jgi:uncharacterized integral membrane protein
MNLKLTLIAILVSFTVIFIVQNVGVVEIKFLYWQASMSSALLIFFALLMGFILGWFMHDHFLHRISRRELMNAMTKYE